MALPKILQFLWGDLSNTEVKKYGILGIMFLNVIGSYWLLRPIKSGIFKTLVGLDYLPTARVLSFCVIIPLILVYSKLVDKYPREKLIYIICTSYLTIFCSISFLLTLPEIGLSNTQASPTRILGWISFFSIESFGSIVVALFWSFVASHTVSDSAKKGYAIIVTGGQIGSILGPLLVTQTEWVGISNLILIAGGEIVIVMALTKLYMNKVGYEEERIAGIQNEEEMNDNSNKTPKKPKSILIGLKLLFSDSYLLGIFGISTIYEIVGTIMDYQLKSLAQLEYPKTEDYTAFMASFGVCTNMLTFIIALLGTSYLMRKFGLRTLLLIYPIAVMIVLVYVLMRPNLMIVFFAQVCLKGLSYALNNPSKEMLYLVTSPDVKFKVKSWTDMFGGRSAKATGAIIISPFSYTIESLLKQGTLISLVIVCFWLFVAFFTGNKYKERKDEFDTQSKVNNDDDN
eukprot:TRINITY_DN173_c0_g1_i1.p1 TRINITY_DN173_c0_g1~~TRINITY_DN173_c0_g1_i1.p1  ORF type:complete len:457 (-),score=100.07 TRINITY_DN173_c0_g1_i1:147-1517(-)